MVQAVPASLGQLKRLKMLNLNVNQITSVPTEVLTGCRALHTLLLHFNPITAQVHISSFSRHRLSLHSDLLLRSAAHRPMIQSLRRPVSIKWIWCSTLIRLFWQEFEATDGFHDFEQRRKTKYSKNIATGVSIGSGLEEGVDRQLK